MHRPHSPVKQFSAKLDGLAAFLESRPWAFAPAALVLYAFVLKTERLKPLWHDELYTYYIAQAPTFARMIHWTQSLDLNPPLYYILARATFHLVKPGPLAVRLPSIVGYLVAIVCVFLFVRRRTTPLHGWLGALILLGSNFGPYSFEARPYALMFGFLGIAAIGWQSAIEEGRTGRGLALLLLFIGAAGMLLSHVLALIAYGAFFFAECIRFALRRKPDWILWAVLVSPLAFCASYLPLMQNHGGGAYPIPFQASPLKVLGTYSSIWMDVAPLLALAMVLIVFFRAYAPEATPAHMSTLEIPEISFAIGLVCVPIEVGILFMRSHSAYFPRYGMAALFGAAILVPHFMARWKHNSPRAALTCVIVFIFGVITPGWLVFDANKYLNPSGTHLLPATALTTPYRQVEPGLPFVDASGLTFLEMNDRETPAFLSRVYYLTDEQAAIQYAHATIFEGFTNLKHDFPIRGNVTPYRQFVQQHRRFLVYGTYSYPEDWLLRKLLADGATLKFLGDFPSIYDNRELYEVTVN